MPAHKRDGFEGRLHATASLNAAVERLRDPGAAGDLALEETTASARFQQSPADAFGEISATVPRLHARSCCAAIGH
jgi:hypothetical protein